MAHRFRIFRRFVIFAQRSFGNNRLLRFFESLLIRNIEDTTIYPPIFIVGAPRTGSTLLFQLLIKKYRFAYLNNLQSFFWRTPALFMFLTGNMTHKRAVKFELRSKYGYIPGIFSPSEGGALFRYWFGEDDLSFLQVEKNKPLIRKTIGYISSFASAPFLSKNLYNSMRIQNIFSVFPNALFIWIRRDPRYTSQSLIKMRRALYGSDKRWASVKPHNYNELLLYEPFEQVVRQIKEIEDEIEEKLKKRSIKEHLSIHYEDLCKYPSRELLRIWKKYKKLYGFELEELSASDFNIIASERCLLPTNEWQRLVETVEKIYGTAQWTKERK